MDRHRASVLRDVASDWRKKFAFFANMMLQSFANKACSRNLQQDGGGFAKLRGKHSPRSSGE
ncbi:hypothetical protein [Phaeobacter inhibens]|uniref:hypothetical protein n=1 Tax=Phaeobacter inhibens TaxID=221822 RepID=UPI000F4CAAD6|nr:hypothetical protein [Phaeobacter inhibens]UWR46306.1 hypothetical protein K4F86_05885 [Phaeobacter inhibens]UWR97291.1 hypothetical protein K4K99_05715 [Phaeobacter inhibens]